MEMNDIITLVTTVGFPIVMCGGLFWYMIKLNDQHKETITSLQKTIENNTNILIELKTLIANDE